MKDSNNSPTMTSEKDKVSADDVNLKKYLDDENIPEAMRKMAEYLSTSLNTEIGKLRTEFRSVTDELTAYRLSVETFEKSMDRKVTVMKSIINDQANEITLLKRKSMTKKHTQEGAMSYSLVSQKMRKKISLSGLFNFSKTSLKSQILLSL